jgi:SEC-C motif
VGSHGIHRAGDGLTPDMERQATDSVTIDADGTVCIGKGCVRLVVPKNGALQVQTTDCPEEAADAIRNALAAGVQTIWEVPKKKAGTTPTSGLVKSAGNFMVPCPCQSGRAFGDCCGAGKAGTGS